MSRYSTPASELGRLAVADGGDDMAVTRSMTGKQQRPTASRLHSSRDPVGRARRSEPQRQRSATLQRPAANDSSDNSTDGSSSEEEGPSNRMDGPDRVGTIRTILSALSTFPNYPVSVEIGEINAHSPSTDRALLQVADAVTQLVRNDSDLLILSRALPIGGALWSLRVSENMQYRFRSLWDRLNNQIHNPGGQGLRVEEYVNEVRRIFITIDSIRVRFFRVMAQEDQQRFAHQLATMLEWLVVSGNQDLFQAQGRQAPQLASEGVISSLNPYRSMVSERGNPLQFVQIVDRMDAGLLRVEHDHILNAYTTARQRNQGSNVEATFLHALYELWRQKCRASS